MKIDRSLIEDPLLYDIMYFSPIEVGEERYSNQLYFQTEIYARQMPSAMVEKLQAQIEQLRHVELGLLPFDDTFRVRHQAKTMFHLKMALAYLDAREARISMKLCDIGDGATKTTESAIEGHPQSQFELLRVSTLSVKACAARRVKFFQKAIDALTEAKNICIARADQGKVHPLMTALTLLNLSAVLGDTDHDSHGLRWGLEALSRMYDVFSGIDVPEVVQAYYLVLACHNAALLSVKLGKWSEAEELVLEGVEWAQKLGGNDDGLYEKLVTIGAQAKHVPQGFFNESLNALHGWGEEKDVWNLSFWDFSPPEICEEIRVLRHTTTLKQLVLDLPDDDWRKVKVSDAQLARLILAAVRCQSLERLTIAGMDFHPRKVWQRVKRSSFLESSWYGSALNFSSLSKTKDKPSTAVYQGLLKDLNSFSKRLVLCLTVLGNECSGVDLSSNGIGISTLPALVAALKRKGRPRFTRQVSTLILQSNDIDVATARELAKLWDPMTQEEDSDPPTPTNLDRTQSEYQVDGQTLAEGVGAGGGREEESGSVLSLDVSHNNLGDEGFEVLMAGISLCKPFRALRAEAAAVQAAGCSALGLLASTQLELLDLSHNSLGCEGARSVAAAVLGSLPHLRELSLSGCDVGAEAAPELSAMVRGHEGLRRLLLDHNQLSGGVVEFCQGAADAPALQSVRLAYNGICSVEAAVAIGGMMESCQSLIEVSLSGNRLEPEAICQTGSSVRRSQVLALVLEDMGLTDRALMDFLKHRDPEAEPLHVLSLSRNPVGDEGLQTIAESSTAFTELGLADCSLTAASRSTLLKLLSMSPRLRRLDLSNNNLGSLGCMDMVSWMAQREREQLSLRSLELKNCQLGNDGFCQLTPVLGSLNYLGVSQNSITSAGVEAVVSSTALIKLAVLDLSDNQIGEEALHALTARFQQEHKRSLWNPKQLTSVIDTVILKGNPISPSVATTSEVFLKVHNPLLTLVF